MLEQSLAELDAYILAAMIAYQWAHRLPQPIPGIDQIAGALILIDIGDDMTCFSCADRLATWAALCPRIGRQSHGR